MDHFACLFTSCPMTEIAKKDHGERAFVKRIFWLDAADVGVK